MTIYTVFAVINYFTIIVHLFNLSNGHGTKIMWQPFDKTTDFKGLNQIFKYSC